MKPTTHKVLLALALVIATFAWWLEQTAPLLQLSGMFAFLFSWWFMCYRISKLK